MKWEPAKNERFNWKKLLHYQIFDFYNFEIVPKFFPHIRKFIISLSPGVNLLFKFIKKLILTVIDVRILLHLYCISHYKTWHNYENAIIMQKFSVAHWLMRKWLILRKMIILSRVLVDKMPCLHKTYTVLCWDIDFFDNYRNVCRCCRLYWIYCWSRSAHWIRSSEFEVYFEDEHDIWQTFWY